MERRWALAILPGDSTFRILQGSLPAGTAIWPIPESWDAGGGPGLLVEFVNAAGRWIGGFEPGASTYSTVRQHPNGRDVVVVSSGAGYVIDPFSGLLRSELGPAITNAWSLGNPACLILERDCVSLECIGVRGRSWRTGLISSDGLEAVRFEAHAVHGLARNGPEAPWKPFTVDLATGQVSGGADRQTGGTGGH